MSRSFRSGVWLVDCQICYKTFYSDQILKRWDGLLVCKEHYETRHPLDFIRPPKNLDNRIPFANKDPMVESASPKYVTDGYFATDLYQVGPNELYILP